MLGHTYHVPPSAAPPLDRFGITFPWEVPDGIIIVEYGYEYWRVVTRDRAVALFDSREAALAHARAIAALYIPQWTILERDEPSSEAIAC